MDTIRTFDPHTSAFGSRRWLGDPDSPPGEQLPGLVHAAYLEARIARLDYARCSGETRDRIEDELASLSSAPNSETLSFYNGLLNESSLLEYLPANGFLILERAGQVEAEALELEDRFQRMRETREERGELPGNFPPPYQPWNRFQDTMEGHRRVSLQSWVHESEDHIFQPSPPYYGRLEQLAADVRRYQA